MLQARLLKMILISNASNIFNGLNVLCASDLNRAQHTVLELFHGSLTKSNLSILRKNFYIKSADRFTNFKSDINLSIFDDELEKISVQDIPSLNNIKTNLKEILVSIYNNKRSQSLFVKTNNKKKNFKKPRAGSNIF